MTTDGPQLPNAPTLPNDLATCHALIEVQREQLDNVTRKLTQMEHQLQQLLQKLYGRSSEKVDPRQMAISVFQSLLLPMLKFCANGDEVYRGDVIEAMAGEFNVSDAERAIMLEKVNQSMFVSRVGWARSYLKAALLIEMTRRGYFRITERGKKLLQEAPAKIDIALLDRYPEFVEFRKGKPKDSEERETSPTPNDVPTPNDATPEEALEKAHRDLRSALESELLRQVMDCTPAFFERMVVELLVAMGYGGTLRDAGKAIGKSGDGGVDGVIKEDHGSINVLGKGIESFLQDGAFRQKVNLGKLPISLTFPKTLMLPKTTLALTSSIFRPKGGKTLSDGLRCKVLPEPSKENKHTEAS